MDIFKIDLDKLFNNKDLDKSKDIISSPIEEKILNLFNGRMITSSIHYKPIGPKFFPPPQDLKPKIARSGVKHIEISRSLL